MSLAFVCTVVALFAMLFIWESAPNAAASALHPAGLVRWAVSGNWLAKVGALIISIGGGALLRYLMLTLTVPPASKLISGVVLSAGLGVGSALLTAYPLRRALSLALAGAALAIAYLTAYSAYGLFHYVADVQALALLFMVACTATVFAVSRRALSIAVLGMIGAYIAPAFALQETGPFPVYGYYVAASLVTLVMVWLRGWRALIHLSFLFTLAGALFFGWTQKFYTPQYYVQMQPMLLALVAIHLAMPLFVRRFDQVYFLLLPIVAAVLGLTLAPQVDRDGALTLMELGGLWIVAAVVQHLRFRTGSALYLGVATIFLAMAALLAVTDVPILLIVSVALCLVVVASRRLQLSDTAEYFVSAVALTTGVCYVLGALFQPPSILHLLLDVAMITAGWTLKRRERTALSPIFLTLGTTWLVASIVRELGRLEYVQLTQLSYLAAVTATAIYLGVVLLRYLQPNRQVLAALAVALFATSVLSSANFAFVLLIPLMLAGQILFSALALQFEDETHAGSIARSMLPVLLLPWAITFAAGKLDCLYTLLVASALFSSLQSQWRVRQPSGVLNLVAVIGFVFVDALLLYESLLDIERQAWAVCFELVALVYVLQVARSLSLREIADKWLYEYAAVASIASVGAAMLLRLLGPPGTLTIFSLNEMLLPAVVSLLWAAIGALMIWFSTRKQSRTLWSLGAGLLVAATVKLILFDFGSLGQIGNILATLAVGGVVLLVAWRAPFPPKPHPPLG